MLPLISVGIPTFNRPNELKRTLEMITGQTYQNLEIIVSDNATAGSEVANVMNSFCQLDDRITFFRQDLNVGPTANFQFVLDRARGDYFMWCADDDWRDSYFVEKLWSKLQDKPDAALAFCNFEERNSVGLRQLKYPDHLQYLNAFTDLSRCKRLWNFFRQDERLGKANLLYGLVLRSRLAPLRLQAFVEKHGFDYMDNLLVYRLLMQGPLALEPSLLYACTVGNVKDYKVSETETTVIPKQGRWHRRFKLWAYYLSYVRLTPGLLKFVPLLVMLVRIVWPRRYRMKANS